MPAGEVRGADDRLHGVGEDRRLLAPAGELLALAEQQVLADAEALGHLGQGDGVHDRLADLGEGALVEVGVHAVHVVGDDHAEHGVAEELEALVRGVAGVLGAPRAVHERGGRRSGGEVEPEALDELREVGYREGDREVLEPADDVVDGVAHRLQVLEVLVVDAEADGALAELLLQRLHQLDEGQAVGLEVVGEALPLA